MPHLMTAEDERLQASSEREVHWKRWGPYLSERQWGTVREDYSARMGLAGLIFRTIIRGRRAYRWGDDGLLGFAIGTSAAVLLSRCGMKKIRF